MPAIIVTRPSALLWALGAAVVVVLYLRAIRPPRVTVTRPSLWREVLGEPRSSASAWRRRRLTSAAIHVAVVLLLALAAADPCLRSPRTVVFVVDNSRSMQALEAGDDRLAKARAWMLESLETIGPREYVALVTTAGQPLVVLAAEQNLQRAAEAVDRIRVADLPSCVADALDVARRQAARGTRLQVHLLSDGCFDGAAQADFGPDVVIHPLGSAAGNAVITRLAVRRYPSDARRFQVNVEVTNRSDTAMTTPLRVLLNDQPIHQSECQVDPYSTATPVVDLESETGGSLTTILDCDDALLDDNRLETTLSHSAAADETASEQFPEAEIAGQTACDTRSPLAWASDPVKLDGYGVMPLWPWFVLVALLLLAVEWALYHRRWTC